MPVASQPPKAKSKKTKKSKPLDSKPNVSHILFDASRNTADILNLCAISYLLKNGYKINDKEEDQKKFSQRRQVEIQIQRLTEKLTARIPKGRNLTNTKWLETLAEATSCVPENEAQAKSWQDNLLKGCSLVPFPVIYETNEDMTWFKKVSGRLCVKFNGLGEHTFQVYCDQGHLHWFQRFLADKEIKKNSKDQHSSGLFTLRSSKIAWQEGEGKGEPWDLHHLTLYCSVDTRLWTAEKTKQVKEEKATEIAKILTKAKEKGGLNQQQEAFVQRKNSTLARINNPFPRPSKRSKSTARSLYPTQKFYLS